jgi:hypothetical protein
MGYITKELGTHMLNLRFKEHEVLSGGVIYSEKVAGVKQLLNVISGNAYKRYVVKPRRWKNLREFLVRLEKDLPTVMCKPIFRDFSPGQISVCCQRNQGLNSRRDVSSNTFVVTLSSLSRHSRRKSRRCGKLPRGTTIPKHKVTKILSWTAIQMTGRYSLKHDGGRCHGTIPGAIDETAPKTRCHSLTVFLDGRPLICR